MTQKRFRDWTFLRRLSNDAAPLTSTRYDADTAVLRRRHQPSHGNLYFFFMYVTHLLLFLVFALTGMMKTMDYGRPPKFPIQRTKDRGNTRSECYTLRKLDSYSYILISKCGKLLNPMISRIPTESEQCTC